MKSGLVHQPTLESNSFISINSQILLKDLATLETQGLDLQGLEDLKGLGLQSKNIQNLSLVSLSDGGCCDGLGEFLGQVVLLCIIAAPVVGVVCMAHRAEVREFRRRNGRDDEYEGGGGEDQYQYQYQNLLAGVLAGDLNPNPTGQLV
jgi:hypothetical protein